MFIWLFCLIIWTIFDNRLYRNKNSLSFLERKIKFLSDKTYFTNNFTYLWNKMYSSGKEYHIAQQIITQIVVIWVEKQILLSKLIKDNTVIEKQWKDIVLSSIDRKKMDFIIEHVYILHYLEN